MAALCARLCGKYSRPVGEYFICRRHFAYLNAHILRQNVNAQSVFSERQHESCYLPKSIDSVRFYSKSKSKGEKKKKGPVQINENEISEVIDLETLKVDLQHAKEHLRTEFVKNLTIRSGAGSVENLQIEFEGETYPLQEVAIVSRKSPQLMVINLAALPQALPAVLKAINSSGMGLNPQQDGTTIFIPIPKVTREHREQLAKNAKVLFNKFKDHIRDIQNKHIRDLKKQEKTVSSDLIFSVQNQIHTLSDSYVQEAEKMMIAKQNELLGVKE